MLPRDFRQRRLEEDQAVGGGVEDLKALQVERPRLSLRKIAARAAPGSTGPAGDPW
jgi:hypothetical protein